MNLVTIASILISVVVLGGIVLARVVVAFSETVTKEQEAAEKERSGYNPALTKGFEIPVDADPDAQLKAARKLAAKRAAALPPWANLGVGRQGQDKQPTAFDGLDEDPVSMVKIAKFHGWQGVETGFKAATAEAGPATAVAQAVAPTKSPDELVPGKDYEVIEITDDMAPAEVRKARIANAKARSAAVKALKEKAQATVAVPQAAPAASGQQAPAQAAATGAVREPQPGVDYEEIAITDDMDPAEVRKARIANAKARSAAMKRLKEQGVAAAPAAASTAPAAEAPAPAAAAAAPTGTIPSNISPPEYIDITDDMDPAEVRKARIANAKAKSAFQKALKEAGIDPATVEA